MKNIFIWFLFILYLPLQAQSYVSKYDTEITINKNKLIRKTNCEIVIGSKADEDLAYVELNFSKLSKLSGLHVEIKDLAGNIIRKLSSSDIKTRSAISNFSLYEDNQIKYFTGNNNTYPYILNYSYQEAENQFFYIDYWSPVIRPDIPVIDSKLKLHYPSDYRLNIKINHAQLIQRDTVPGECTDIWRIEYNPISTKEPFSPDISKLLPYVKIVPIEFYFAKKGSQASWIDFGNWEYNLFSDLQELPDTEKKEIDNLKTNINDSLQILKVLYHYLQDNTRYINVSLKTGGMVPYPASYVCENRYGDCKALSNYFIGVLKYAGFKPVYCSVYAGDNIKPVDLDFPSQQSNHIIVCVPITRDSIWLDCTSDGPFGYLGTFTQGRDVLLIEKDNSHYVKTPSMTPEEVKTERKITVNQKNTYEAEIDFKNTYRGNNFDDISYADKSYNTNKLKLYIKNNLLYNAFQPEYLKINKAGRDENFIGISIITHSNNLFIKYGDDFVLKTIQLNLPVFEKPSFRQQDVQINYPICQVDSQVYILQDSYQLNTLAKNINIENKFGYYKLQIEQKENKLYIQKLFVLNRGYYTLSEYPEFYSFWTEVKKHENNCIIELKNKEL